MDGGPSFDWGAYAEEKQKRLDKATRLLCEILTKNPSLLKKGTEELRAWWENHLIEDGQRKAAEREKELQAERDRQAKIEKLENELSALKGKNKKKK